MPQMGESLSEGTIVKWLKQPGEPVAQDEPLFELSTDKVDTEVPAPAAGILARILASEGETVAVGASVAIIELREDRAATTVGAQSPSETVATQSAAAGQEEPGGHFKSTHAPQLVSFRREGASAAGARHVVAGGPARVASDTSIRAVPAATSHPPNRTFSPAVLADAQRAGLSLGQLTSIPGPVAVGASPSATSGNFSNLEGVNEGRRFGRRTIAARATRVGRRPSSCIGRSTATASWRCRRFANASRDTCDGPSGSVHTRRRRVRPT